MLKLGSSYLIIVAKILASGKGRQGQKKCSASRITACATRRGRLRGRFRHWISFQIEILKIYFETFM